VSEHGVYGSRDEKWFVEYLVLFRAQGALAVLTVLAVFIWFDFDVGEWCHWRFLMFVVPHDMMEVVPRSPSVSGLNFARCWRWY
jgi:hypothetical protein